MASPVCSETSGAADRSSALFSDASWWDESAQSSKDTSASFRAFGAAGTSTDNLSPAFRTRSRRRLQSAGDAANAAESKDSAETSDAASSPQTNAKRKASAATPGRAANQKRMTHYWTAAASEWRRQRRLLASHSGTSSVDSPSQIFGTAIAQLPGDESLGGNAVAHLLPCKISFTGAAAVKRHFRPLIAYAVPEEQRDDGAHPGGTSKKREREERPAVASADADRNGIHNNENVLPSGLQPLQTPHCAVPSSTAVPSSGFGGKSEDGAEKADPKKAEAAAGATGEMSDSEPVVLEALLHGRLLRGLAVPLARPSGSSGKQGDAQSEKVNASPQRDNTMGWYLTEGCQGYVVSVTDRERDGDEGEEVDGEDCEGKHEGASGKEETRWKAAKGTPPSPPVTGRKELIPLGSLSHLCYWQQDVLPTPTDDVMQALAFMRAITAMHDWRDEFPAEEEEF
ncbi:ribonuclease H1/H2 small subunit protein [Besnoitia besnoiti]|uniref:Ribonuclease H1/H2 small subunit protein n=1 Tax=Besnoitia besnoiti TaxID=94643 RepID=A0A2A9MPU4_BESBE|nr:ribonuclease H1/H2 small subunit protein [Besnoitia besnoiti]PFH37882.1 ribonuclease H1/H2 small subunit protein [Besnoitia besnoiti]